MSHCRVIEEKRDILLRCTNVNVKIIACLQASNGLNEDQVSEIEAVKALRKQCQLLYDWLKNSHDLYLCFVNVMEENEQIHVAHFLKGNHEEPHVPLSIARYERLIKIKPKLMDSIHYSETLLSTLEAKKAISMTDCQDVRVDVLTNYKRNYILINAIQRRSNYSFVSFDEALRATHQDHAADYLYEGEVVAIHVNTNHPELDNPLSQSLNETIVKECASDSATKGMVVEELNGINCHLLSCKPEKSIVIFLYCKTTDDMALFIKAFNSGCLKSIIERIFNRLIKRIEALEVKLRLDDEEVLLIGEFTGIEDWLPGRFHSRKCIDSDDRVIKDEPVFMIEKQSFGLPCPDWQLIRSTEKKPHERFLGSSAYVDEVVEKKFHDIEESPQTTFAVKKHEVMKPCEYDLSSSANPDKEFKYGPFPSTNVDEIARTKFLNIEESLGRNLYLEFKLELERAENDRLREHIQRYTKLIDTLRYKSDPFLIWTIRRKAPEQEQKLIAGLTILHVDRKLFVVNVKSSEVDVYDSMKFSFLYTSNLKELVDPADMGSCNRNRCLYIFDFKGVDQPKEILRVDPYGKLIKKWPTEDIFGLFWGCGLSVTDESNVIVTVFNKTKLNEYSPDGLLIREINLSDAGVFKPFHAIKLPKSHFIVSHHDGLCVVDANGKLKKSFDGECGSTIGQINFPAYLSVDGNGFVLVADSASHRVLLLDSDLEFKREIVSEHKQELRCPQRILLDESYGRLFVADNEWKNQRILIFSIFN